MEILLATPEPGTVVKIFGVTSLDPTGALTCSFGMSAEWQPEIEKWMVHAAADKFFLLTTPQLYRICNEAVLTAGGETWYFNSQHPKGVQFFAVPTAMIEE